MPIRLCLVPIEESTAPTGAPWRGPKYFPYRFDPDPPALFDGVEWQMMDFGLEPTALLAANLTAGQVSTLAGLSDVTMIPANLDNTLGAQRATVAAALESLHIPGDALTNGTTYRQVVRGVIAIFQVAQRFHGRLGANGRIFPAGITLSTTLGDLSQSVRNELQAAAEELGYSYAGLTLSSTLRDVLKALANQQAPGTLLGVSI
jgi:hypothetical protein